MARSMISIIKAANKTVLVNGQLDAIPTYFDTRYVAHLTSGKSVRGHAAIRKIVTMYVQAFAEIKVDIEILVQGQDRIGWQRTLRALHAGSFKGFPATGRRIVWRDMVVSRIRNGLIAEDWVITDLAEQLLLSRKNRK